MEHNKAGGKIVVLDLVVLCYSLFIQKNSLFLRIFSLSACISSTPGMSMTRWAKVRTAQAVVSGLSAEIGMTSPLGGSPRRAAAIFATPQSLACSRHDRAAGGNDAPQSGSAVANVFEQDRPPVHPEMLANIRLWQPVTRRRLLQMPRARMQTICAG